MINIIQQSVEFENATPEELFGILMEGTLLGADESLFKIEINQIRF